jgi:WD40 repeat protein
VAWSPDGTRLATGSDDQKAKVWDTTTGKELRTLRLWGHIHSVAWSPDGRRLATGNDDDTVQIYAMDIRDLMALAHERVTPHPSNAACQKYLHMDKCPSVPVLP